MSVSVISTLYTGANQSGSAQAYSVGHSQRYHRIPTAELVDNGLHRAISSATLYGSSTADNTLVLFRPFVSGTRDYNGRYLQIANRRSSEELDLNLAPHDFDNTATCALLIAAARGEEFRLSFRDIFLDNWRDSIDPLLTGGARRDGDPVLTWEMFPQGITHLDPGRIYLKIHQPLDIVIDWWPDYRASLTYHLYMYVDSHNHLRGSVHRWAYWIEGGLKADDIEERLRPAVINGMETMDAQLNERLDLLSALTVQDVYFLPGRQLTPAATGVTSGTTTDDVTIVIEL